MKIKYIGENLKGLNIDADPFIVRRIYKDLRTTYGLSKIDARSIVWRLYHALDEVYP